MVDRAKDYPQATWFYAVCIDCDAKWFSARAKDLCPRCGQRALACERLTPPWLIPRTERNATSPVAQAP